MTISEQQSSKFIQRLEKDFPDLNFRAGHQEHWSPRTKTITYNPQMPFHRLQCGLLHEIAHAILGHASYKTDFELLKLESQAWELAAEIGKTYGVAIDEDHVQNCLDTYRDWLHRRSTCPKCGTHVLQKDANNYLCHNCQTSWKVSSGRFSRSYRKTKTA